MYPSLRSVLVLSAWLALSWLVPMGHSQDWKIVNRTEGLSLRGIAPLDDKLAWACGNKGTILKLTEGGTQSKVCIVQGLSDCDYRSIHAWDGMRCIVATAGQPAKILKTLDGGVTWRELYQSGASESFFNSMKFMDPQHGIVFGDPIQGRLEVLVTSDEGETWRALPPEDCPEVDKGEAGFAASNSSMTIYDGKVWIGLGGRSGNARLISCTFPDLQASSAGNWIWESRDIVSMPSHMSRGIFSVCFSSMTGWLVGGDYKEVNSVVGNSAHSLDRGITWKKPSSAPRGFRSGLSYVSKRDTWIAVGPSGTDRLQGQGAWESLSEIGFHAISTTPEGDIWACGSDGRIGRLKP